MLGVYEDGIRCLSETSNVDVVICCLTPEVLATCWSTKRSLTRIAKRELKAAQNADQQQMSFDALWTVDAHLPLVGLARPAALSNLRQGCVMDHLEELNWPH